MGLLKCSLNPSQYSPVLTLGLVCLQKETKMRHLFHITAPWKVFFDKPGLCV